MTSKTTRSKSRSLVQNNDTAPRSGSMSVTLPSGEKKWVNYFLGPSGTYPGAAQLTVNGKRTTYNQHVKEKNLLPEPPAKFPPWKKRDPRSTNLDRTKGKRGTIPFKPFFLQDDSSNAWHENKVCRVAHAVKYFSYPLILLSMVAITRQN